MPHQERPPQVAVQQVPTIINLGTSNTVPKVVVMEVSTVVGSTVVFIDPDAAEKIGRELLVQARQAKTGIIIAPPMNDGKHPGR